MKEMLEIFSDVCSIAAFIISLFTATNVHKISQRVVDKSRKKGNTNIAIGFRGNDFVGGNKENGKS